MNTHIHTVCMCTCVGVHTCTNHAEDTVFTNRDFFSRPMYLTDCSTVARFANGFSMNLFPFMEAFFSKQDTVRSGTERIATTGDHIVCHRCSNCGTGHALFRPGKPFSCGNNHFARVGVPKYIMFFSIANVSVLIRFRDCRATDRLRGWCLLSRISFTRLFGRFV